MATGPGIGDKPLSPQGTAGWYALTETSLARLTRENWGHPILDMNGRKKDPGVQEAIDEIVAFLSNTEPIDMRTPLGITNNTGGNNSALNIVNNDNKAGDVGINISNNSTGDIVSIGPTGLSFYNPVTNNTYTLNNLMQTTVNQGDTITNNNTTNEGDNISGPTFVNTTVFQTTTGDTIINNFFDDPSGCTNRLRRFTLLGAVVGRNQPETVSAIMQRCRGEDPTDDEINVGVFDLKTSMVRGPASAGDEVIGMFECGCKTWYLLTTARGWTGSMPFVYGNSAITIAINSNCTGTITYTKYTNIFQDGVLVRVTDESGEPL